MGASTSYYRKRDPLSNEEWEQVENYYSVTPKNLVKVDDFHTAMIGAVWIGDIDRIISLLKEWKRNPRENNKKLYGVDEYLYVNSYGTPLQLFMVMFTDGYRQKKNGEYFNDWIVHDLPIHVDQILTLGFQRQTLKYYNLEHTAWWGVLSYCFECRYPELALPYFKLIKKYGFEINAPFAPHRDPDDDNDCVTISSFIDWLELLTKRAKNEGLHEEYMHAMDLRKWAVSVGARSIKDTKHPFVVQPSRK